MISWKHKNTNIICYILTSLVSLQQGNVKKFEKSMKVANIEREYWYWFCAVVVMRHKLEYSKVGVIVSVKLQ